MAIPKRAYMLQVIVTEYGTGCHEGLPPYLFSMLALYSGLRREEILALQWDCVFLDASTPYISVRRAWRSEHNRPVISTVLKTKAAERDIPIPKCLVDCLREARVESISEFVISDRTFYYSGRFLLFLSC